MGSYILRRLLSAVPVLLGLTIIVFLIMEAIPGDTATAILGSYATPENVEKLNRDLGLNKPMIVRYVSWLANMLTGDFGESYSVGRPVLDDEVGDLVLARARGDRDMAGDVRPGVGDELLGAVDDPAVAVELGSCADVARIRAGLGLRQAEGAELAAGAQVGQVALLLGVGAVEVDGLGAQRRVGAQRDRDG